MTNQTHPSRCTVPLFRARHLAIGAVAALLAACQSDAPEPGANPMPSSMTQTTNPSASETQPAMSTLERNKAIARRWSEELWGQGRLEVADEIIAPNYVRHDPGDPFPARGPEDVKRIVSMLRGMLPDLRIEIEDMVAEGDRVVTHYVGIATDGNGYMGLPATGSATRTRAMQIFRFEGDRIAESWAVRDDLGTLIQLGHLPPPGSPGFRACLSVCEGH